MEQYKDGYTISEINGYNNTITFLNGTTISVGEAIGDVNESTFRRIQIRETIKSHLEKERELYKKGIKVLSLFFALSIMFSKYSYVDNTTDRS